MQNNDFTFQTWRFHRRSIRFRKEPIGLNQKDMETDQQSWSFYRNYKFVPSFCEQTMEVSTMKHWINSGGSSRLPQQKTHLWLIILAGYKVMSFITILNHKAKNNSTH